MIEEEIIKIERSVIGLLIQDQKLFDVATSKGVTENSFSDDNLKSIFSLMKKNLDESKETDISKLMLECPGQGQTILACFADAPVGQNVDWWFKKIVDAEWRRNVCLNLSAMLQRVMKANLSEIDAIRDAIAGGVEALSGDAALSKSTFCGTEIIDRLLDALDERVKDFVEGKIKGVPSGFPRIDEATGNFKAGRLYVLAARPAIGKTTLALNWAIGAAAAKNHSLFFTNEMGVDELYEKVLSNLSRVNARKIERGCISNDETNRLFASMKQEINKYMHVNNTLGCKIETIESECKNMKRKNLDIVFIDYIGLIDSNALGKSATRQQVISDISRRLKRLSQTLQIPIVVLAQLNREGEKSEDIPSLSTIKDSGSIEQDADVVFILHRDRDGDDTQSVLKISKNRFGFTGIVELQVDLPVSLFKQKF